MGVTRQVASEAMTIGDLDFDKVRQLLYDISRIDLGSGKRELVQARLGKRLKALGLPDYHSYVEYLAEDTAGDEIAAMVDVLTTNLTFFFREPAHYAFIKTYLTECKKAGQHRFRIWSAGCSSGEEPYTIAMTVLDALGSGGCPGVSILATDISVRMLKLARQGVYPATRLRDTPEYYRGKYFTMYREGSECMYRVKAEVSSLVRFARLNLADQWPMRNQMDVIVCRNVMIYFNKQGQQEMVQRFYDILKPGSIFIVGHSESLTGVTSKFRYLRPSIYQKPI